MDGADGSTTFTDAAGRHTVTANGNAQIDTAQSKFGGASGLFDGTGDYLSIPDSADWDFSGNDFTIDGWWKFNIVTDYPVFASQFEPGISEGWIMYRVPGSVMRFQYSTNGTTDIYADFSYTFDTSWHHYAIVRNGANLYFFVDGTQTGSTYNISTHIIYNSNVQMQIGAHYNTDGAAGQFFNGWIDEFRISNIARWTSNFTPPSAAY
jgi:hypothetical protein